MRHCESLRYFASWRETSSTRDQSCAKTQRGKGALSLSHQTFRIAYGLRIDKSPLRLRTSGALLCYSKSDERRQPQDEIRDPCHSRGPDRKSTRLNSSHE